MRIFGGEEVFSDVCCSCDILVRLISDDGDSGNRCVQRAVAKAETLDKHKGRTMGNTYDSKSLQQHLGLQLALNAQLFGSNVVNVE